VCSFGKITPDNGRKELTFVTYLCPDTNSTYPSTQRTMKFLGFLLAIMIILTGFSMLVFLALFVGYWLTLIGLERVMPERIYKWLEGAKR